jgi:hypothetical protein
MSTSTIQFKHVSYLWDDAKAAELAGDEVALLIYRSNLLGADLTLDQLWRRQYFMQGNG